jgi:hypothetical protein
LPTRSDKHGPPAWSPINKFVLGALLSVTLGVGVHAQKVSFPGARFETKSPDDRYTIQNADDEKREPAHTLTLIDAMRGGSATKIYSYGRHVDVLWSPTSSAFVVNDYEGSDAAHPILFTTTRIDRVIDLREILIDFLRSEGTANSIEKNQHVYVLANRWVSGNEIECEVSAYGNANPKGFTKRYVYKVGEGFRADR